MNNQEQFVSKHLSGRLLRIALTVPLLLTAEAAAWSPSGNRVQNPGAEDPALIAWSGTGWSSTAYGEPGQPSPADAALHLYGDGSRLFGATGVGALTQTVDVSDLSDRIDNPSPPASPGALVGFGGSFGGPGNSTATASLSVQALNGLGQPLTEPELVGNPTARDRGSETTLVTCVSSIPLPTGTRRVRLTLTSTGPGAMADAVLLVDYAIASSPSANGFIGADGAGCRSRVPVAFGLGPTPSPQPTPQVAGPYKAKATPELASMLSLPATRRCGKARSMRFTVTRPFATRVRTIKITARGRTRTGSRSVTIAGPRPRRSMLVRIAVTMTDGQRVRADKRYRGCGR